MKTLHLQQTGVGVKSGAKVDKFKEMKLTKQKSNFISCPMIRESPVSVECKVKEIKELGSHHMFIAEVLAIHADNKYIDEKGAFDISKCDLIAYSNGGYYLLGRKIGKFGYSVQKNKKFNTNIKENKKQVKKIEKNKKTSKNEITATVKNMSKNKIRTTMKNRNKSYN